MAFKVNVNILNAMLDAIESGANAGQTTGIGANAILKLRTGAPPTAPTDADTGTVIATLQLPSDWLANASGGSKSKSGTWQDLSADNAGTIGHFRVYDSTATNCGMQGTVTKTGLGGDMTVDNDVVEAGQVVQVTTFVITAGNQ